MVAAGRVKSADDFRPKSCSGCDPRLRRPLPNYLADLERLVNIDCGSYTKAGVDEVGGWVATRLRELGAEVTVQSE